MEGLVAGYLGKKVCPLLFALMASVMWGQAPAPPRFEVASVKPSEDHGQMYVRVLPGGRLLANAPARLLLMNAYGIQFSQLSGVSDWLTSETWSIDARAEGNPSRGEMMSMLQSLLEERFHLKVRHESREMSIFALTVARNGPKLTAPKDGGCATSDAGPPPCGRVQISMSSQGVLMEGRSAGMTELARVLAIPLGRSVADRTGLTGTYDIHLQFIDDGSAGNPPAESADSGIFTAIQEQLGLKLVPAKGPVDVLVIDHIERPGAN